MTDKRGPWSIVSTREAYDNRWIRVTPPRGHHAVRATPASTARYTTRTGRSGSCPVDAEQHTFLVGQYRFALDAYSWEIPGRRRRAGWRLPGVRQEGAAGGDRPSALRRWHKLFECDLSNSVSDETAIAFLACQLAHGQAAPDSTEELAVRRRPLGGGVPDGQAGEIRDAISIMALQAVELLALKGRLRSPAEVRDRSA